MLDTMNILFNYFLARRQGRWHSRAELESWQLNKFRHFARRTLIRAPYYKSFVEANKSLSDYPLCDKATMMKHFDEMNTRGLSRQAMVDLASGAEISRDFTSMAGDISAGLSSGTSGNRGLFVASKKERLQYAGVVLAKCLPESILKEQRIALLLRANNQLYETVGRGKISFRYVDLFSPWTETVNQLQEFQPTILVGAPQTLALLAKAQEHGHIKLSPVKIISGAEVLDKRDAQIIQEAFGCPVDQIYQATEGFLGTTCGSGTLHLNEDFIIFERQWIDKASNRFMPIITDFTRSTQPIIRYRLDDILIEKKESCACGSLFTAIERIEGRIDDILFLPRVIDRVLVPVMPDFVRDVIAPRSDIIGEYCVSQVSPHEIKFSVTGLDSAAANTAVCEALQGLFNRMNLRCPSLIPSEKLLLDPKEKLRRVKRLFQVPEGAAWTAF